MKIFFYKTLIATSAILFLFSTFSCQPLRGKYAIINRQTQDLAIRFEFSSTESIEKLKAYISNGNLAIKPENWRLIAIENYEYKCLGMFTYHHKDVKRYKIPEIRITENSLETTIPGNTVLQMYWAGISFDSNKPDYLHLLNDMVKLSLRSGKNALVLEGEFVTKAFKKTEDTFFDLDFPTGLLP